MIELSVAVPMLRARHCGWIALESLIRQEDIDFEWELVIAEEIIYSPFTKARVMEYKKRLEDVGCVKIKYFPLKHWERLSNKLVFMAKRCENTSKIFASNSADLYAPPKRLKTQYDEFMKKVPVAKKKGKPRLLQQNPIHFYSNARTIVYDIKSGNVYLNDGLKKLERYRSLDITDGSCRSLRMNIMKQLPPAVHKAKSVDSWVWMSAKKIVEKTGKDFVHFLDMTSNNWKYGLNVNGLNNITKGIRHRRATGRGRPFFIVDCPINIRKTIPHEILDRLVAAKKHVAKHSQRMPKWVAHKRIV